MVCAAASSLVDTDSTLGTSVKNIKLAGPRYSRIQYHSYCNTLNNQISPPVYYRVYTEDQAIPSVNPIYADDPSLGRIPATLVTPPHTVISLKRCLSKFENITGRTRLYIAASSQTPMDDTGRVSILAYPGPGCNPNEPMALVVALSDSNRDTLKTIQPIQPKTDFPSPEGLPPFVAQYCERYQKLPKIAHCT
jgi:hypothetical protein